MTKHELTLKALAELLISALVDVNNAKVKFEVLAFENDVHKNTKKKISQSANEMNQTITRFHKFWGEEGKKVMEEQILDLDHTLQIQEITHNTIGLPKEYRDRIEEFTNDCIKEYKEKLCQV